jgi:quercetin dioxygenase-like cupin family protein
LNACSKIAVAVLLLSSSARGDAEDAMGRRVQELLRAHQGDVYRCVSQHGVREGGEMLVRVFVGSDGRAMRPEVLKDESGGGGELGRCLVDRMRAWDVRALQADAGDQIVFPLVFQPDPLRAHVTVRRDRGQFGGQVLYVLAGRVHASAMTFGAGDVIWSGPALRYELDVEAGAEYLEIAPVYTFDYGGREHGLEAPKSSRFLGVRGASVKALPIAGGKASAQLYLDGTEAPIAVERLVADAGVKIPPHRHDGSDELIYVVSGRGTTTIDGVAHATVPGATIVIPKGAEHSLVVDEKLTAVQVYAPGGPEQRFKTLNSGSKK